MTKILQTSNVKGLHCHSLQNGDFLNSLQEFCNYLASNYGPYGNATLVQNSAGGDILTSSSHLLGGHSPLGNPTFRFVNALMEAQNQTFGLFGLYTGLLCSKLLYTSLLHLADIGNAERMQIVDLIIEEILNRMSSKPKEICVQIDYGSIKGLLPIVKTLLNSKNRSVISDFENEILCIRVIESFLQTVPMETNAAFGKINIVTVEGPSTDKTEVMSGILYRVTDDANAELFCFSRLPIHNVRIGLFTVPFTTENTNCPEVIVGSKELCSGSLVATIVNSMKKLSVSVIANQKYIDASIMFELQRAGFIVMDRLGTALCSYMIDFTGCKPISTLFSLASDDTSTCIGHISCITQVQKFEKSYLHLQKDEPNQQATLMLCGINNHVLDELEVQVTACVESVQRCLNFPYGIVGGGCLEGWGAQELQVILMQKGKQWAKDISVKFTTVCQVFHVFISSFTFLGRALQPPSHRDPFSLFLHAKSGHLLHVQDNHGSNKEPFDLMGGSMARNQINEGSQSHCICGGVNISRQDDSDDPTPDSTSDPCNDLTRNISLFSLTSGGVESLILFDAPLQKDKHFELQQPLLLDCYDAKLNSIRLALEGFSQLNRIGICIFDR